MARQSTAAALGRHQHEGEQGEGRGIVERAGNAVQVDALEAAVHVVGVVHDHAAGAEQLGSTESMS
jgi:hypothetical protein